MENFGFCRLRVSKVHHLIKQLIDDDEVVPDTLLLQLFEVLCEDLHNLMEEEKDFGSVCVSFGQREEVEVVMANIEVL